MPQKKLKKDKNLEITPEFCDFSCAYADFGDPQVSGACRKELAIWCKRFKKYNNKNNRCFVKQ